MTIPRSGLGGDDLSRRMLLRGGILGLASTWSPRWARGQQQGTGPSPQKSLCDGWTCPIRLMGFTEDPNGVATYWYLGKVCPDGNGLSMPFDTDTAALSCDQPNCTWCNPPAFAPCPPVPGKGLPTPGLAGVPPRPTHPSYLGDKGPRSGHRAARPFRPHHADVQASEEIVVELTGLGREVFAELRAVRGRIPGNYSVGIGHEVERPDSAPGAIAATLIESHLAACVADFPRPFGRVEVRVLMSQT